MSNKDNFKTSKVKGLLSVSDYIKKYNVRNKRGALVRPQAIFNKIYRYEKEEAAKPPFEYIKDAGGIWIKE